MATTYQPGTDPTNVMGRRIGAWVIDIVIMWVLSFILFATTVSTQSVPFNACEDAQDLDVAVCTIDNRLAIWNGTDTTLIRFGDTTVVTLVSLLYIAGVFWVLQGLTGATPGKALFGVRTVNEDGEAPGIPKAFIRWILWIVDAFPYCCVVPLVGGITALSSRGHRRIGDMGAKTYVVSKEAMGSPIIIPPKGAAAPQPGPPGAAPGGGPMAPAPTPPGTAPSAPQQGAFATPTEAPPTDAPPHPAEAPAGEPAGDDQAAGDSGPRWDPERGAYIQWDAEGGAWLQFDDETQTWKPLS